jgi:hypothetical protein
MSAIGGPNIVEDGLVLALDAANEKSFRGEPTVNLLYDDGSINWTLTGLGGTTLSVTTINANDRYRITCTGGIGQFRLLVPLSKLTNGLTYNLSFKYNMIVGDEFIYNDWCDVSVASNRIIEQRIGYRFQSAFASRATYDNTFRFADFNLSVGHTVEIWDIQLEQRNYSTPFVNGTRGTTVATGGGWADMSGNSIHGELVNNPTFDSDNLGSLSFDGTDEFINYGDSAILNSTLNGNTDWSISYWVNPISNGRILDRGNLGADPTGALELNVRSITRNNTSGGSSSLSTDIIGSGWNYVTLTRTASLFFQWYLNGIFSNSNQTTENYGGSGIWKTGRRAANLSGIYEGKLSNLKIYNKVLLPEEVLQNYNATKGRFGL